MLAFGDATVPPQDVNIARVTARAALGREPVEVRQASLEEQLAAARPRTLSPRAFTYALFDTGALHCKAVPHCHGCPLAAGCASRSRLATAQPRPRRSTPRFQGSTRQLRGAVLREMLSADPPRTLDELRSRAGKAAEGREPAEVGAALDALVHERLASPMLAMRRIT